MSNNSNVEENYEMIKENYSYIQNILQPNLSSYNQKIVSYLFEIINSQLSLLVELCKSESQPKMKLINKNLTNLSQHIANFLSLIKDKKFNDLCIREKSQISFFNSRRFK